MSKREILERAIEDMRRNNNRSKLTGVYLSGSDGGVTPMASSQALEALEARLAEEIEKEKGDV